MRFGIVRFSLLVLALAVAIWSVWRSPSSQPRPPALASVAAPSAMPDSPAPLVPAIAAAAPDTTLASAAAVARPIPAELASFTYARAWHDPAALPPAFAAFHDWVGRYARAATDAARGALLAEGCELARQRRAALSALLPQDPAQALAFSLPAAVIALLPPDIRAEVETRFSTRGDLSVLVFDYSAGEVARRRLLGLRADTYAHRVTLEGREYPAYVYGRRAHQTTKHGLPLHGILVDGMIALHEAPLRALEPDEAVPAGAQPGTFLAEAAGRVLGYATARGLLRDAARQEAAEQGMGPELQPIPDARRPGDVTAPLPDIGGGTGVSDASTAWTVGPKNVLVIRVDFSDLAGEPRRGSTTYTQAYIQNLSDTEITPYYAQSSFGQTSITTTVTSQVYRMPQTAASYATSGANTQLHTDARTAAAANHNVASFDRVLVLFSSLGSLSGSQITYGGLAEIGGRYSWINGEYDFRVVAHELGHTYGVRHANLWLVADGNPVSATGTSWEYADDFDTMGANFANDRRTDFNPWFKNLFGWVTDSQVRTINANGTYRLNRFDHSSGTGMLALKVGRDATRNYWIGVRRNFTTNASMQHGAYVIWGYNTNQPSTLLDLNTPGNNVADAALGVGATLVDTVGNVAIRNVAEGGTAPNEYLDVQVTLGLNGMPVFEAHPQDQSYNVGATVALSVVVTGTAPFSYQWLKDNVEIAGATGATLDIPNAQPGHAGLYRVRVSNAIAPVVSNPAIIAVNAAPRIIEPPVNVTAALGRAVTLSVGATGAPAPTYQWRKGGTNIPGATNATLAFSSLQAADASTYDVVVTNSQGSATSASTTIVVNPATMPPANDLFANGWTLAGNAGTATSSSAGATGETGEPTHINASGTATSVWYRWTPSVSGTAQIDTMGSTFDTVLAIYTGTTLTTLNAIASGDQDGDFSTSRVLFPVTAGTTYHIAVGDWSSSRAGGVVQLRYGAFTPPAITTQPVSVVSVIGGTASFSVGASGSGLSYQWYRNGTPISGATGAALHLSDLSVFDAGSYLVVVSNLAGSVTSQIIALSGANAAPAITNHPGNAMVTSGQGASFTVAATGTGALAYQWRRNGVPIVGAINATLTLPSVTRLDADVYDVAVASGLSATVSQAATLRVAPTAYPDLVAPDSAWDARPEMSGGVGYVTVPLADGRAYIGGDMVSLDRVRRTGIARLTAEAAIDPSFVPPEFDAAVRAIAIQPDGKVIVGGDFTRVNGAFRHRLVRLLADGSVDSSFHAGSAANGTVGTLAVQADGKILVGGAFTSFAGSNRNYLVRLTAEGSVDDGFLNRGMSSTVNALLIQPDGQIIVGGFFANFVDVSGASIARARLARLTADGALVAGFSFSFSTSGGVIALALQPDGALVFGGTFTTFNGVAAGGIARVSAAGVVDDAFNSATAVGFGGAVNALALDGNGRILVGGSFTSVAGVTMNNFARLSSSGSRDASFQTRGFSGSVTSVGISSTGGILVGGGFSTYLSSANAASIRVGFAQLNSDGTLNSAVNVATRAAGRIATVVPLAGGKLLVGGFFDTLRGVAVPRSLARLNADGTVDPAFNAGGSGVSATVSSVMVQPDGKIVAVGSFAAYNSTAAESIIRLLPEGVLDPAFVPGFGLAGSSPRVVRSLSHGRILVAGLGSTRVLTATGSRDPLINPSLESYSLYCAAVDANGRILLGGTPGLLRLNSDGTPDVAFNQAVGAPTVYALAIQPDGKILIGGTFISIRGVSRLGLARLTSAGEVDTTFVPPALNNVHALVLQEDGRVIVRGSFAALGGAAGTAYLARLNADGTRDTTFGAAGVGAAATVPSALALNDSGRLFMSGSGYSSLVAMTNAALPVITTQPLGQIVSAGGTVTLSVVVSGSLAVTYQWLRNGTAIPGATQATLTMANAQSANAGTYSVVVTSELGSVTSAGAVVTVGAPRGLIAASELGQGGTGASALAGTFTIEGSVSKQMLVRAVGPSLAAFGVSGLMADPQLTVVDAATGATVATNDNWGAAANAAQVPGVTSQVGGFPLLGTTSLDAVVLATFAPGTYRARLTGAGSTTGTALLEIYDADTTPRLVYLSARGSGTSVTAGFTVASPPAGRSYLIRALGPSLGIPGAMSDPQLTVFRGATTVAANNNWNGDAAIVALAASAGAMPLAANSLDAALILPSPEAASYSAQASGGSGTVLLEIFEVDAARAAGVPPAIVSDPEALTAMVGQPIRLGVVVNGKPAPTLQWRRNGEPLSGATQDTHVIPTAQVTDAGSYDLVATNASGTATSGAALVTVPPPPTNSAAHAVATGGFIGGGTVVITNTLTYVGTATSLGWSATLPAGWSFASDSGAAGDVKPVVGATGTIEWAWTTPPATPVVFNYTVNVPGGNIAVQALTASAIVRVGGSPLTFAANALAVGPLTHHTVDTDRNLRINLVELTRFIELFNTRNGTVRTGAYQVATTTTEDGLAPDPTRAAGASASLTRYHSGDTARDGRITLIELTRVIELYNYRNGTQRTGEYHVQHGTEDGFAPGP